MMLTVLHASTGMPLQFSHCISSEFSPLALVLIPDLFAVALHPTGMAREQKTIESTLTLCKELSLFDSVSFYSLGDHKLRSIETLKIRTKSTKIERVPGGKHRELRDRARSWNLS